MQGTGRIVFNTVVLYTKILVCLVISLWTVPIVLSALGKSDFGLYNLVAGVVAMLAFLNGAMTISTQRFLSVTRGGGSAQTLQEVYNLSLLLHIAIAAVVALLVEVLAPLLLDSFLTIDPARLGTARRLLDYLVVSMFFSIVMVPFDAVLNAYENLLAYSVIGVVESLLRLTVALSLTYFVAVDRLNIYGMALAAVMVVVFVVKVVYVSCYYRQLRLSLAAMHNDSLFKEMFFFAGWNTISSLAIVFRNQGLAVVLNHFFGTVVNAAYGIGNQINGVLGYFSTTIHKSVNPQLMQSHGAADGARFTSLVFALGRFSTLAMGIVAVPIVVEMPYILRLWLTTPPEGTVAIARLIIVLSIIYQLSSGLMSAVQATGRLRWYTITIGLLLLSTLPIAYAVLRQGGATVAALVVACGVEAVALCCRLCFARHLVGLSITAYLRRVVLPVVLLLVVMAALLTIFTLVMDEGLLRLVVVGAVDVVLYSGIAYTLLLSSAERTYVVGMIHKLLHR